MRLRWACTACTTSSESILPSDTLEETFASLPTDFPRQLTILTPTCDMPKRGLLRMFSEVQWSLLPVLLQCTTMKHVLRD